MEDVAGAAAGEDNKGGARNPIKLIVRKFRARRTAGGILHRLRDLTGNEFFGEDEVCRKGGFVRYYVGRIYNEATAAKWGILQSTEVMSMGLEWISRPQYEQNGALDLLLGDPEHFGMMVAILTGRVRL
jgi:hypothetical protein